VEVPSGTYLQAVKGEKRSNDGRFARYRSDQELIAVVRQVIEKVGAPDPLTVTQAVFDETRSKAGHAESPRAFRMARQLGVSWSEVLELAFVKSNPDTVLSSKTAVQGRDWLTRAEVEYYLGRVARHLGTEELSRSDYETGREELVRAAARKGLVEGDNLIPTEATILHRARTWTEAIEWAGLREPPRKTKKLYPAENALDDFVGDFGALPSRRAFSEYQRHRGLSTGGIPKGSDYVGWRDRQMKNGPASRHGAVEVSIFKPGKLDPTKITPAPDGYEPHGFEEGTYERAVRDLSTALDLTYGNLTQRRYQKLATQNGLCSVATIQRVGKQNGEKTWADIRDEVIASRAKAKANTKP
jgi:hypothetical protein